MAFCIFTRAGGGLAWLAVCMAFMDEYREMQKEREVSGLRLSNKSVRDQANTIPFDK